VLSAWRWLEAEPAVRPTLIFYAQPWFWGTASVLLLLILFKEVVIARVPGAKKPLDALQLVENKVSGLLASPVAVGALAWALHRVLERTPTSAVTGLFWGTAWAGEAGAAAMPDTLAWTFALVGASAVYGSVWLASHTLNVLILLSPFGLVDNVLKLLRFGLLVTVALLSRWVPMVGALVCGVLALVALLTAGSSYRLMRFGASFVLGLLGGARRPQGRVFAFSAPSLGLPVRTAGWLSLRGAELVFRYRRAFVLPRTVVVTRGPLRVERGLLHPVLLDARGAMAFRLTPRVRGHEAEVAQVLGGLQVEQAPAVRGLQGLGRWLKSALVGDAEAQLER
jgi:hypothetical protein